MMRYGSCCSGIEAASVAWHPLGWEASFLSEIEPFPCAVLNHHYPNVPNLGDMTKYKEWPDAAINVLVGGTPCQSFSVAGLRKGLADPRGNLMLTYLAIADKYRPEWLVWENVPGVLSSNGGRDFASLLRGLAELGYGFAYRILDAQFCGVPQRRRRVFVVGCLGSWQRAAAVLFERHSLQGHNPPSREKGQEVAASLASSSGGCNDPNRAGAFIHSAIGIDGRDIGYALRANASHSGDKGDGGMNTTAVISYTPSSFANYTEGVGTLKKSGGDLGGVPESIVCMSTGQAGAEIGIGIGTTLNCNHEAPIITHDPHGFNWQSGQGLQYDREQCGTLIKNQVHAVHAVRRLTPEECESLQGFSRGYTNITVKGKPAADGPRYKALGNSMAVPCMEWIGKRIQKVQGEI